MRTTSEKGLNVIKAYEGLALRAYRDSVGVWTIGYGLTNFDVGLPWKIGPGLTITAAEAEEWLPKSLRDHYEPAVREVLPEEGTTQAQFDAGTSFHWNTGAVKKASWPKFLVQGKKAEARLSILSWNHAGGKVLAGLTRRRQREWAMCDTGDYGPEGEPHRAQVITRNEDNNSPTGPTAVQNNKPVTPPGPGMLGLHDQGPEVTQVQSWLIELGLLVAAGETGTFDEQTARAVLKFQRSHPRLTADGVVGPATRAAIQRDLAARTATRASGKVAGVALMAGTVGWQVVGHRLAVGIGSVAGVLVAASVAYAVYRYRDEIVARFNRLVGRTTP